MSWSGLASNQAVSWADLLDAVANGNLPSGGTVITSTNQCIYKSLATITNYVNVQTGGTYGSRATNDLLLQADFVSNVSTPNSFTVYCQTSYCISVDSLVRVGILKYVRAGDLNIGDDIYTKATANDLNSLYKIKDIKYSSKETVEVRTNKHTLIVSLTQPVLKDNTWTLIKDLSVGDNIYTEDGYESILSITEQGIKDVLIYTVEGAQTFYAGGILCHNKTTSPLTGWSAAATACSSYASGQSYTYYYSGTFDNGTEICSNTIGGGLDMAHQWGVSTTNYYYNATTNYSFTVTVNTTTGKYTVANYATCAPTMPFKVKNTNASSKTTFTAAINAVNVTGMLSITLPGASVTTTGSTVSEVVGTNTVTLTGGASTKTISSIVDVVTLGSVSYTITSGNGTSTLILSVTLTSANETNGILITIS